MFVKPPPEPRESFTVDPLEERIKDMYNQGKFDKQMENIYGFKKGSQESKEYFSKLEFPVSWYQRNYRWADWVAIGVALLGLGIVIYCAYGNVLAYLI